MGASATFSTTIQGIGNNAGIPVPPFFERLSNSLQRMHVDLVNGAKSPETRARRIGKAVGLFADGKQR